MRVPENIGWVPSGTHAAEGEIIGIVIEQGQKARVAG